LGGREECISLTRVDGIVEVDWAIPELPAAVPSAADRVIATHVVERLRDGCCIQLGIGGLPNAVGELISRSNLKELGIHTEMFTDSMVDMIESGQVTGTRKTLDRRKVVYTFALGSSRVYSYLKNNPIFAAFPVDYTNDPYIIGSNDNVVSINSCVEIDLFGQVCSESSGPRHISGTGGQVDFALGAMRSKGGAAFMCMPSTFDKKGALRSRIRPTLTEGSIVTTPRAAVSHVVTEQGVVCLKGMATWQRAEALISIAHPQFRDELVHAAEKLGIWRQSNKKS
jgi:acyl-CoA hydrolase